MNKNHDFENCSFCGKHKDTVKKLIVGNDVAICSECVSLCQDLLDEDVEKAVAEIDGTNHIDPRALKEYLDQYVVGQDRAKAVLSVAIANHYKRIANPRSDLEIEKANILMLGPTGSGKTLLVKTIAKYLNVPFAIADATSLTEAGYVGDDVESVISRLLTAANGNVARCQHGIIFIDEIDKIGRKSESTSITRDVSGEGVQQALLKMVEGTVCRVSPQGGRKHPGTDMVDINTKNILFIAGGAFVGLEQILQNRLFGTSIGFASSIGEKSAVTLDHVTADDLVKFGMIPEFVGRFPSCVGLYELSIEQLVNILTNTKNSLIKQYEYLFSLDDVELHFADDALKTIAERSQKFNTGARGLHSEIERVLLPHMYNIATYRTEMIKKVTVTSDQVNNPVPLTKQGAEI